MSLYVDPKQSIIDAVNAANATTLKLTDVTFGAPAEASSDVQSASGKNTSLRLTGNGSTWSGSVVVNYIRRDLNDLTKLVGNKLKVAKVTQVHDLIKYLNYLYGMVLTTDDLENDPIALDDSGASQVTIRAKTTSYGWIGSYNVALSKGDAIIDYDLADASLDGLNYPTNQSAKGQAPLALYGFDFTASKAIIDTLKVGDTFTSTANDAVGVKLAADITKLDSNGWAVGTSSSARNLYQAKVVYNGLNKPEFATNQNYKYVLMLQCPDGSGNNGVPTTVYNTAFFGVFYLHYNDPEDVNAVT